MSTSKITGVIDGISDYKQKDFFNIAVGDAEQDDNWYIGDGTLRQYGQFDKGDKVRVTVDDNKGSVTNVEPVGKPNDVKESGASEDGSSRGSDRQKSSPMGESTGSDTFIPKDERIQRQVALKEACETARQSGNLQEELRDGNHEELVNKLANAYYGILQDIGGDQ